MGEREWDAADISRWAVIYPVYINSKKTIAEGRRIAVSQSCENPTISEIVDCCTHLKLSSASEPNKAYSRDFMQRGRVRVQLKGPDQRPVNPSIPTKTALLHKIAELVPAHPGRRKRDQAAASTNTAAAPSGKGGKSGKKKK